MSGRIGDWIQTYRGRKFWPLDPRPEDVDLFEIAHALGHLCRFGGHCLQFYSVAEHCVLLSRAVPREHALSALLHDAAEAYLVDLPRPIKRMLPGYQAAERLIEAAVADKFGLADHLPEIVADADRRILTDEAAQNMAPPPEPWSTHAEPLGVTLQVWPPQRAEVEFLDRSMEISRGAAL